MSDADQLLDLIEKGIVDHGGDLGGWTRRFDDTLQLFDGRVTLRAKVDEADPSTPVGQVHAHVYTTLHEYDDEVLDACLYGMGDNREAAIGEAAVIWITLVAGPIKSFIDNKPVCMTCQAGVAGGDVSKGYCEGDYGLPNLRAYVGPSIARGLIDDRIARSLDDKKPWFRYAAESAAPRRVHLAKSLIFFKEPGKACYRELEIDGHDVSHHDPDWPAGITSSKFGYLTRFAVFEFPRNSTELVRRAELERTIRHFAENFSKSDSVDRLMEEMVKQGFDPDLVHETESIGTIAFGRLMFERHGVQYASTIIRARKNGQVEMNVPLMAIPAYSRARAIGAQLATTMKQEDFQQLCVYNAESNGILQAMESVGDKLDLSTLTIHPCIVPDRGVSEGTMNAAFAKLEELMDRSRQPVTKPWWKFW